MPYQKEAEAVLAMWRDIERALADAIDGSPETEHLLSEAARLRDEYQRLINEATAHHRPVPPAFPD